MLPMRSRFVDLIVVSVEKPNSHKYDEPKGKRVLIAVGVSFDTGTRNFFMVKPKMKAQLELKWKKKNKTTYWCRRFVWKIIQK